MFVFLGGEREEVGERGRGRVISGMFFPKTPKRREGSRGNSKNYTPINLNFNSKQTHLLGFFTKGVEWGRGGVKRGDQIIIL